ncbi:hypothetical protein GIB67_027198 [Kingdonia uniflora]|uniref:Pentatricopeptide repeat-containing protein n=1 Tax=Kingdonia uniflora TaxID=39325 RepID=A0A7J7KYG8_9MAGN|nr:hypothetical protein GIB67_027198 [Kingdonia uniflora]
MIGIRFAAIFEVQFRGPDLQPQLKEFTKVLIKSRSDVPLGTFRIFQKMKEFQCEPTNKSYVTVFSILSENQLKLAQMFHKEIPNHGYIPDYYTYGTLINELCKLGKISEAEELFKDMDTKDCSPTVVTYTSLIHGSCLSNILDEAMELFEEISRKEATNLLDEMVPDRMLPIHSLNACFKVILMKMLDQSGGASSIANSLTTLVVNVVNGTGLTLPTLLILCLTLLGLALDPSLVGLPAISQSILVLIVPEGVYTVIFDEVIREEAYLYVDSRTLGDVSTGEAVAWLKIFTIIQ